MIDAPYWALYEWIDAPYWALYEVPGNGTIMVPLYRCPVLGSVWGD